MAFWAFLAIERSLAPDLKLDQVLDLYFTLLDLIPFLQLISASLFTDNEFQHSNLPINIERTQRLICPTSTSDSKCYAHCGPGI